VDAADDLLWDLYTDPAAAAGIVDSADEWLDDCSLVECIQDVGHFLVADLLRCDDVAQTSDLRTATRFCVKAAVGLTGLKALRVAKAAKAGMRADSALQGALLREHLRLTEKYGTAGVRELENGRIRYYGDIRPARTPGEMAGQRTVREWDPATGRQRTWLETLDQQGRVRIVRPETGGPKRHYYFDEKGGYGGSR
jgi:hypothetical protein